MVVLTGHSQLDAQRQLGLETVPLHIAKGLSGATILTAEISA